MATSEKRMSLLFQKPAPHIASHLQRYLPQQSGHNDELLYQQQQQQQHQSGGEGNMNLLTIEQQQWHQQQVVTASAKKQLISSRQIGKLQPQMPNYLFSNARYNPTTSQRKADSVAIDPVIAAAAAKIAAAASAALEERTAASGVISPLGRLSGPSQQYYAQIPYSHQQQGHAPISRSQHDLVPSFRQQQPRPQQVWPQQTRQIFASSSPKQQARGEDCEFTFQNNNAHSQSLNDSEYFTIVFLVN